MILVHDLCKIIFTFHLSYEFLENVHAVRHLNSERQCTKDQEEINMNEESETKTVHGRPKFGTTHDRLNVVSTDTRSKRKSTQPQKIVSTDSQQLEKNQKA